MPAGISKGRVQLKAASTARAGLAELFRVKRGKAGPSPWNSHRGVVSDGAAPAPLEGAVEAIAALPSSGIPADNTAHDADSIELLPSVPARRLWGRAACGEATVGLLYWTSWHREADSLRQAHVKAKAQTCN